MSDQERMAAVVLVADDDEDILMLVKIVLEEDGYEVITATDGQQALGMATELLPDLCVLDVMMPKLDGCEVTSSLRAAAATRGIPVILLSAKTQWEAVQRGREAGADEYVTKPFIPDELQRSVRALLSAPPVVEEPVPGPLAAVEEPPAAPARLVLVAASDLNLARLVSYRLELGGYEVAMAHDPEEAVQIASEHPPDLCILDAAMPQLDGCPTMRVDRTVSVQELYGEVEQVFAPVSQRASA